MARHYFGALFTKQITKASTPGSREISCILSLCHTQEVLQPKLWSQPPLRVSKRLVWIISHPELMAGVFSTDMGILPLQLYLKYNLNPWEG